VLKNLILKIGSNNFIILVTQIRKLRSVHFVAIHLEFSHLAKVLGGNSEVELVIGPAQSSSSQAV